LLSTECEYRLNSDTLFEVITETPSPTNDNASAQHKSSKASTSTSNKKTEHNASAQHKSGKASTSAGNKVHENNKASDDDGDDGISSMILSALSDYILTILHPYRP
jgi:hypothetical protein